MKNINSKVGTVFFSFTSQLHAATAHVLNNSNCNFYFKIDKKFEVHRLIETSPEVVCTNH